MVNPIFLQPLITCPRCGQDALVRTDPDHVIQPVALKFYQDAFGPTNVTMGSKVPLYPIKCTALIISATSFNPVECDYWGVLDGGETQLLLTQIVRRTGDVNV